MSARLPNPVAIATDERDQFVVSHGKSGVLGVFTFSEPAVFSRGTRVIVKSERGLEVGAVLGPASITKARLFGATSTGILVRPLDDADGTRLAELAPIEQQIFDTARAWSKRDGLTLEILDVDLLFDGLQAIIQFVGKDEGTDALAPALEQHFHLTIRLENLAHPEPHDDHAHKCDKPDCGKESGGCTSCSTGGGCSTCGSAKVDMREYFAHLRTKMENRIPLT